MKQERRNHLRVVPTPLKADICSSHLANQEASVHAKILNISRSGIRIKLDEPLKDTTETKIKIIMYLPDSDTEFSIHCILKNKHSDTEYGLHYIQDNNTEESIDDMLFECIKLEESMFLIKSSHFSSQP